jgi:hypothetical protein
VFAAPVEYVPAVHAMHVDAPGLAEPVDEPAEQLAHTPLAAALYVPGAHCVHPALSAPEYSPAEQAVQFVAPMPLK